MLTSFHGARAAFYGNRQDSIASENHEDNVAVFRGEVSSNERRRRNPFVMLFVRFASLTDVVSGGLVSPNPGPSWKAIGMGDFNPGPDAFDFGDGQPDILWQNANGAVSIWEMSGNKIIGGGPVSPNPGPAWRAVGTGDFYDTGDNDILFQNANTGQVSIWEMSGNKIIGGGPVGHDPGPAWKAIGTGFFDEDRRSDIVFQNTTTGQLSIWDMNGTEVIGGGPVNADPGPSWRAIAVGDFDGVGDADILLQNTTSGQTSIWEMGGTSIIGGGSVHPELGPSWKAEAVA
jgi:hypothetical protein